MFHIGIQMWNEPFIEKDETGSDFAILLMDTQGNFDSATTTGQNATIFAFSSLLSSVVILNTMKNVSEDVLQYLQLFASYALIATGNAGETDPQNFQSLVFLLRDFDFDDYEYGYYDDETVPPNQEKNFKKENLDSKENQPEETKLTHEFITRSYQNVGVYAMPHPGKKFTRAKEPKAELLDEDFVEHLQEFVWRMLTKKKIFKTVAGQKVS